MYIEKPVMVGPDKRCTCTVYILPVCLHTAYQHLSRTVEVSRVHLFDILTQYRAIFPDDDSAYHVTATPTHLDGALFYTWLGSKVIVTWSIIN